MATFFSEKICIIHEGLAELQDGSVQLDPDRVFQESEHCLNDFSPITEDEVCEIIKQSTIKSCCLDTLPTQLVKDCLDVLLSLITRIMNQFFTTANVPKAFKIAAVTPILRKANLIAELLNNFCPISPSFKKILRRLQQNSSSTTKTDTN